MESSRPHHDISLLRPQRDRRAAAAHRAGDPSLFSDGGPVLVPLAGSDGFALQARRFERRVFSGADQWGALPDGSLWVARVYDNRVDWRDPSGTWTRGEPLPDRIA